MSIWTLVFYRSVCTCSSSFLATNSEEDFVFSTMMDLFNFLLVVLGIGGTRIPNLPVLFRTVYHVVARQYDNDSLLSESSYVIA
jgi:hypothetical protein